MSNVHSYALVNERIVPLEEAQLSVGSSAVLYGLSVYSVIYAHRTTKGFLLFRVDKHLQRLKQSAAMIGFSIDESLIDEEQVTKGITELLAKNKCTESQFVRITVHATDLVPGIKTRDLTYSLSVFLYDAQPILPNGGARIKTSLWRRTSDTAIPARAKVNGAYVNSALAKQDALDSGYDDCLFLNSNEYVSELSAANIFYIKDGALITPDTASDILEGITRKSLIVLAKEKGLEVVERKVALTELYTADEVFACGTSAFVSGISEIDKRIIVNTKQKSLVTELQAELKERQTTENDWTTLIKV